MYVEFHSRSAFSFLEGASLPEALIAVCADYGMPAMALLDRNGVYGAPRFHMAAQKFGLRAHIGAEVTVDDTLFGEAGPARYPLLVESRAGYQNLCRLITRTKLRAKKEEGAARIEELEEHATGLVCLTGGEEGPLEEALMRGGYEEALRTVECLTRIFGPQNVYVELQRHFNRQEEARNQAAVAIARSLRLPILATNGVSYATPVDREVLDVFTCIRHHRQLENAGRLLSINSERFLRTPAEMEQLFADLPEAISNTVPLSNRLRFTLKDLGYEFPQYPVPAGETIDSYLRYRTFEGMRQRYGQKPQDLQRRAQLQIEHELKMIERLKLAGYFLIVWDIVRFCRDERILVQGRGSAANSAVCYALGITAVDPVGMELLFERFLSDERGEMPDIDLDLPSGDQRERVIQHVYAQYGAHGAAMTANVITYRGRSAARCLSLFAFQAVSWWQCRPLWLRLSLVVMRRSIRISCVLLCLRIAASAQALPEPRSSVAIPESGFVSPHHYTNAFFGFSLPLPNDRHFRIEDLSETENRAVQHFLFAEKAMDKGLTLLIVSATQVLNSRDDDAQKAAFLPGMQGARGPEALSIGGRLFWKSDVLEKTFSGKLRRIRYATSLGGFVLQFSVSAYGNRTAEELKDSIESIKFFDPVKASEIAGADAQPFLPQAARMRISSAPQVDIDRLDLGRVSGNVYVNPYFGFSYRFADGWRLLGDAKPENAGLVAPRQAPRPAIPGPPEKCSRPLLRATRDAEPNETQTFSPMITVVAADPGCFALDAKFPTSLRDQEAMQLFGQAMVRAFSGTQLTRQDSITLRGVNVDGHIFLEMPNDTAIPVPGSTLLKKIHSSLVLTSIKDYWVIWTFQSESESELDKIMKTAISFESGEATRPQ